MIRWTLLESSMIINWEHDQRPNHCNLTMKQKNKPVRKNRRKLDEKESQQSQNRRKSKKHTSSTKLF